jgi:hypothetical protein
MLGDHLLAQLHDDAFGMGAHQHRPASGPRIDADPHSPQLQKRDSKVGPIQLRAKDRSCTSSTQLRL